MLGMVARMLRRWKTLIKEDKLVEMDNFIGEPERLGSRLPRITWTTMSESSLEASSFAQSQQGSNIADLLDQELHQPRSADVASVE